MTIGKGIAIAGIWVSVAVISTQMGYAIFFVLFLAGITTEEIINSE